MKKLLDIQHKKYNIRLARERLNMIRAKIRREQVLRQVGYRFLDIKYPWSSLRQRDDPQWAHQGVMDYNFH